MDTISLISYYWNLVLTNVWYYASYLYETFREFAFVIKVAAISVTISLAIVLFVVINLIVQSLRRRRTKRRINRMEKRYGDGLRHIMSLNTSDHMSIDEISEILDIEHDKQPLKNNKDRYYFSLLLYNVRISEESSLKSVNNLHIVIELFGIKEFLENLVSKGKLKYKVEGLVMFRAFRLPINQWLVNQLMNTKRKRVQRVAMYSSVLASACTDLSYFETEFFDENCCIYDEIQLGYVLQRHKLSKRQIPNLAHWAHIQKNPSTQCVFIRLMRQFNQKEHCAELEDFFNHNSDPELIQEISRTWGYLKYEEGEPLMNEMLMTQSNDVKVTIMHALVRIGSGNSLDSFVLNYVNNPTEFVKFEALRCIYNYGEIGMEKFKELEAKATEKEKKLFEFFNNPLTKERVKLGSSDIYRPLFGENIFSVV